ncbi:hypothetical protein HDE_02121 [Halotydeus destructor]|nr:hypothetical protein HDE_02121 [Halotydeus destructor]
MALNASSDMRDLTINNNEVNYNLIENVATSVLQLADQNGGRFDERDVDQIRISPLTLKTFISPDMSEKEAIDSAICGLDWRKKVNYQGSQGTDIPIQFFDHTRGQFAYLDDGKLLVYLNTTTISGWSDMLNRLFAFTSKKIVEGAEGQLMGMTIVYDCSNLNLSNVDIKMAIDGLQVPTVAMAGFLDKIYMLNVSYYMKPFLSLYLAAIPKRYSHKVQVVSTQHMVKEYGAQYVPERLSGGGDKLESIAQFAPECPKSYKDIAREHDISDKCVAKFEKVFSLL